MASEGEGAGLKRPDHTDAGLLQHHGRPPLSGVSLAVDAQTHGALEGGRKVTADMVCAMIPEELMKAKQIAGKGAPSHRAARIFDKMSPSEDFAEPLVLLLYEEV